MGPHNELAIDHHVFGVVNDHPNPRYTVFDGVLGPNQETKLIHESRTDVRGALETIIVSFCSKQPRQNPPREIAVCVPQAAPDNRASRYSTVARTPNSQRSRLTPTDEQKSCNQGLQSFVIIKTTSPESFLENSSRYHRPLRRKERRG
ncbi:hypothetical protein QAD02_014141 [Eretmocerus hayati]|uniref:Uncharacterized protein n=1 Tax=Eretmocerus hayati TaxID=131215 RepID=A0ACC2P435_9HYME|nr:hypothetical protein QAD02_014141 [Eretmocerus hayati]